MPTRAQVVQAISIVERALELCGQRSGWTRRVLARDRHSHEVDVTSPRACRFCAAGALIRATTELHRWQPEIAAEELFSPPPGLMIAFRFCGEYFGLILVGYGFAVEFDQERPVIKTERRQIPASWLQIVTTANDLPRLGHGAVVMALKAAQQSLTFDLDPKRRREHWSGGPIVSPNAQPLPADSQGEV